MSALTRRSAAWLLVGLAGVWVAWLGFGPQSAGDYGGEFAPAMNALLAGHLHEFSVLLPDDGAGGSLLLRAPGALAGKLLVGGQLAIFRFGALWCELAAAALGLVLARDMRERGLTPLARAAAAGLCVLAAAVLDAVYFGHPEEALGAVLCIAAVLLSGADRSALAGLALGCALINKPWGLFAIPPVLLANPAGFRRLLAGVLAVLLPWTLLAYGLDPARALRAMTSASSLTAVAHPVSLWWPLAHVVQRPGIPRYFAPPHFLLYHARELAVLLAIPLSLPLARKRLRAARGERASTDAALALLALLLLLRCALDPSNHVYYAVPFVLALLAWESRVSRRPTLALLATGLLWLVFHTISGIAGVWPQYVAYMLVILPLAIVLWRPATGCAPYRPTIASQGLGRGRLRASPARRSDLAAGVPRF